jgi:hypothetical protein
MKNEDYRVDCKNEECSFSGLLSECHNGYCCPICGGNTEPVAD